ncbi:MAG: hypothetical protein ACPL7O_12440, partial [Armatimonadota bacterium]
MARQSATVPRVVVGFELLQQLDTKIVSSDQMASTTSLFLTFIPSFAIVCWMVIHERKLSMTGREKIEAAFSAEGATHVPAVIPYEDIYIRDHWEQLTSAPWWHAFAPDIELQRAWRKEVVESTGYEWFMLPQFCPRAERERIRLV